MDMMNEGVQVVSSAHPFQTPHQTRCAPHGSTITELVTKVQPNHQLHQFAVVYLDGEPVPYDDWHSVVPGEGQHLLIQFVPMGGGSGGKDPLRTVLTIGLLIVTAVYAPQLTSALAGAGLGSTAASVISSGIFLVGGNYLINAIAPIRQPVTTGQATNARDAPNFFLDDARNRRRAFQAIPMVLGKHRVVPPLAAKPATEVLGDQHFLRMMTCWGHGVLTLEDIKIGETPLDEFADVQIEHREGRPDDEPHTLYTNSVEETGLNILLQHADGWISRTSDPDADELSVDFVFPKGLKKYDDNGNEFGQTVKIDISYRKVGDENWLSPDLGEDGDDFVSPPDPDRPRGRPERYGAASTVGISQYVRTEDDPDPDPGGPDPDPDPDPGDDPDNPGPDPPTDPDPDDPDENHTGRIRIFDNRNDPVRHGVRWRTPERAQYEVAVRRVTEDSEEDTTFNEVYWFLLRTITDTPPVAYDLPLATTALSIRASDQLHGSVEELNAIVSCEVLDWNGSAWVKRATSNPASLFRHVLQAPGRLGGPAKNHEIDLGTLQRWHRFCEQNGYEYNAVRDYHASVWDTLSDIAAVGRASPIILENGRWSVTVDDGRQMPVQVFTPRNSNNFRAKRHFEAVPHGLRIRFANRNRGWMYEERLVFRDNYNESNATTYATIDAPGITDPDHVYKFGRFHLAQLLLRREQWQFDVDFEGLVCRRGSRVLIAHDVLVVGEASGRIKARTTNGSGMVTEVTLDTELDTAPGVDYGLSIRLPGNVGLTVPISSVTNENGDAVITFTTPATGDIHVGALATFGTSGEETLDGLVTSIQPGPDASATLSVLPWSSPGVYNAETGPIPPYDPGFGDVGARLAMTILNVRSDESTRETEGGVLVPRVLVEFSPVGSQGTFGLASAECQIRPAGEGAYGPATIVRRGPGSITIGGVEQNVAYDIRLRWNPIFGDGGPWAEVLNHVVSAGVFGFPGDGKRGLSGYSSIITRNTLVATAAAADTDQEWHLSGGRDDWTGARTLTIGGIDADEEDRLSRAALNVVMTIYSDADNWADYVLSAEITFAGTAPNRIATITLAYLEEVGTPPTDGADMALHFSPVGTKGIAGRTWFSGTGIPTDDIGNDGDFYLRTTDSTIWKKDNGTWAQVADLSGADGAVWHTGAGAPDDSLGKDGHFYFRTGTDAAEIYEKVSGSWVKRFDIDDGQDGTVWYFGAVHPDASTATAVQEALVGSYYFLGISGAEDETTFAGATFPDGAVFERKAEDSVTFPNGSTGDWEYIADLTGPQGVPGVRGLAGYANVITRSARASTLANLNASRWHLTGTNDDWTGNRVFTLGGVTAEEESLLGRISVGALVTLYSDDGNWYDYTLFSAVSFTGSGTGRTAALSLVPDEGRGAPPASGAMELHFTPAGKDGIVIGDPENLVVIGTYLDPHPDPIFNGAQQTSLTISFDAVAGADRYSRIVHLDNGEFTVDDPISFPPSTTPTPIFSKNGIRKVRVEIRAHGTGEDGTPAHGSATVGVTLTNAATSTLPGTPSLSLGAITQTTARILIADPSSWGSGSVGSRKYVGNPRTGTSGLWGTEAILDDSVSHHDLTGLAPGTTYQVRLKCRTDVGDSAYDTITFTTTSNGGGGGGTPDPPTNASRSGILVSWTGAADWGSALGNRHYDIRMRGDDDGVTRTRTYSVDDPSTSFSLSLVPDSFFTTGASISIEVRSSIGSPGNVNSPWVSVGTYNWGPP